MGGAERQVCDISDQLANRGHSVIIMSLTGESVVRPENKSIHIVELKMKKNIFGLIGALYKASKIVKLFKPDVVHSHMVHANIFSRILRLFSDIPYLICTAHSKNEGSNLRMIAYRCTDFLANISTNVSSDAVQTSISRGAVSKNKIVAINNGIDTNLFKYSEVDRETIRNELGLFDSDFMLLAVGRLTEAKNYPNLLHAFKQILRTNQNAKLFIVGDGDEYTNIRNLIINLSIETNVFLLGIRHDISALMSASDIFVLSSAWEGFGLVVAEAMACEKIVVATDCGGVRDIIGDCGYLVSNNSPTELASTIISAYSLAEDEKKILGNQARARIIDQFSIDSVVLQWLSLYGKMPKI